MHTVDKRSFKIGMSWSQVARGEVVAIDNEGVVECYLKTSDERAVSLTTGYLCLAATMKAFEPFNVVNAEVVIK